MPSVHYIWSYPSFPSVIPVHMASSLRVTHPSAMIPSPRRESSHRLACVKHSVSVHPEPGSNSSFNLFIYFTTLILSFLAFASSSIFIVLFVSVTLPLTRNILPNLPAFVNAFFQFFCVFFGHLLKPFIYKGFSIAFFLKFMTCNITFLQLVP